MSNFPKYRMSYLNTIKETALKQFFKGVAHEQHWSSILCLWWWSSIVSSFFLKWKFSKIFFFISLFLSFSFSILLAYLHYFGFLKMSNSPKFWMSYLNPIEKTALKQFLRGVAHEQPWSSIVWLLWVSSIVSSFFSTCFFPKSFSPFLCYSLCLLLSSIVLASYPWFLWCFYGISIEFLWEFHGISKVFLWYSMVSWCFWRGAYGIFMGFLWGFKRMSMGFGFLWDFYDISIGILWEFYGISMGVLWKFYRGSMIFLWDFHWISIRFLCDFYGISMFFLWDFSGIPMRCPWYFYWIAMIFLLVYYWISIIFLWDYCGMSEWIL